jgi:hypothetical protein
MKNPAAFLQQQKLEPERIRDVKRKWSQFIDLISRLKIDLMIKTSPLTGMILRFEYAMCLLGGSKMGLGP